MDKTGSLSPANLVCNGKKADTPSNGNNRPNKKRNADAKGNRENPPRIERDRRQQMIDRYWSKMLRKQRKGVTE